MSRATIAPPEIRTVGDLLKRLGDIPPDRIRFDPPPGAATEGDLIAIQGRKEGLFELVDGCIVEKAVGFREATVTSLLSASVVWYLHGNDLGFGVGPSCLFRVGGGVVRSPSLAFIAWDKLPRRRVPREEITDIVPDLVAANTSTPGSDSPG
jgi:Uma2 family endonuclease